MRAAFAAVLVFLAASNGTGRGDDKKPVKIDGTYVITGLEVFGQKTSAEDLAMFPADRLAAKIDGDKLISKLLAGQGSKDDKVTLKTDTSKIPYTVDMVRKLGDKDETHHGIFKIDGDNLIICVNFEGKPEDRPKEFKTLKGSKAMLLTLKKK